MKISRLVFNTRQSSFAPLALRLILGAVFLAHGAQKLFGAWGGAGLEKTAQGFAQMGFQPGLPWAALAASAEFFGAILLVLGLLTRPAALAISVTMAVAVFGVHRAGGFFAQGGGFEYPLTLLVVALTLVVTGSGALGLDSRIAKNN
jgi:putative oxidoreductase